MKTIENSKSLVLFDQNRNRSNIFNLERDTRLLLKENYFNVFNAIALELKEKNYVSFVDLWKKTCDVECLAVFKKIRSLVLETCKSEDIEDAAERVMNKFRGNLGEIFAEAFFTAGLASEYCDSSIYNPVDPDNERFIDADSISVSTNLPMGIQVKNYSETLINDEVFGKAQREDDLRLRVDRIIDDDKILDYLKTPHEIIFSFTDASNDLLIETNRSVVIFLGPKYIDSKKIQGSLKNRIASRWLMFQNIADEISKVQ